MNKLAPADIITVVVRGGVQFYVQKSLLIEKSPVFRAMLEQTTFREAQENHVVIDDLDGDVFEALIEYLLRGEIPPNINKVADRLLLAADKYQIVGQGQLKFICAQHLLTKITTSTAVEFLLLSDAVNEFELKGKCIEFINSHREQVKATKQWQQLTSGNTAKLIAELYEYFSLTNSHSQNPPVTIPIPSEHSTTNIVVQCCHHQLPSWFMYNLLAIILLVPIVIIVFIFDGANLYLLISIAIFVCLCLINFVLNLYCCDAADDRNRNEYVSIN